MKSRFLNPVVVFSVLAAGCAVAGEASENWKLREIAGQTHDTARLQALLDSGKGVVTIPDGTYTVSKTLFVSSDTRLVCSPKTVVRLADGANCPILMNRGWQPGGHASNITVEGGVWDGNNTKQTRGKIKVDNSPGGGDICQLVEFAGVDNLTLRGMTLKDPNSFSIELTDVDGFVVEDILFDCNDKTPNQDGLHVDGWARNGRISNLRGHTNDDLIALNADEGLWRSPKNDIENVVIDGVYGGTDGYTAVRLLSRTANVRNIVIRNVFGEFKFCGVYFSHWWHGGVRFDLGHFDNILIENFYATGIQSRRVGEGEPIIEFQSGLQHVGSVTIRNLSRVENTAFKTKKRTVNVACGVKIDRLVLDNVEQRINSDEKLLTVDKDGKVEHLIER